MPTPTACVLRAPGTNCDDETAFAFQSCGAEADRVHLFRLLEKPDLLSSYQILCIPGGFSYGDDIGAGVIFANQLRGHLGDVIGEFLQADKLVLGICNGFQVLLKSGILPGGATEWPPAADREPAATLTWNNNGKYTARWVNLRIESERSVFLRGIDEIELPVAHAEGKFVTRDEAILSQWRESSQIALCYQSRNGSTTSARDGMESGGCSSPANPNGSVANIAGVSDPTGRVLGLMPHPERFIHATQHPNWTRRGLNGEGEGEGVKLFRNAVEYFD